MSLATACRFCRRTLDVPATFTNRYCNECRALDSPEDADAQRLVDRILADTDAD